MKIGIIGGSGFYGNLSLLDEKILETESYRSKTILKEQSRKYTFLGRLFSKLRFLLFSREHLDLEDESLVPFLQTGKIGETEIVFISRHGKGHKFLANETHYGAIISAMKELGVDAVITTAAVGAVSRELSVGDFVILSDGGEGMPIRRNYVKREHFPVEPLYDERIRKALLSSARSLGLAVHEKGSYALRPGPDFETAKEISDLRTLGYSVVGMTALTEAKIAKNLGIPLGTICLVTNAAQDKDGKIVSDSEVQEIMKKRGEDFVRLLREAASNTVREFSSK